MKFKNLAASLLISFSIVTLISCSDNDDKNISTATGNMAVKAKVSYSNLISAKNSATVTISKFMINIGEIEFEIDDDNNEETLYGEDEIELKGPFEIDFLSEVVIDLTNITLPNNTYEEIEFDLIKGKNTESSLYNKTILVEGKINDVPFTFWHNTEEEIEVDFQDINKNIVINGDNTSITINFNLDIIFGSNSILDFTIAKDGNSDGIIEISPNDPDGNNELAYKIMEYLEEASDLLDD